MTDWLRTLPGETRCSLIVGHGEFTVDELREAFASGGPVMVTTEQAAERFGFRPGYWRGVAKDCPRAVKGRRWLLPLDVCEAHMEARARDRRTPPAWQEATPASTPRAWPQGLQER